MVDAVGVVHESRALLLGALTQLSAGARSRRAPPPLLGEIGGVQGHPPAAAGEAPLALRVWAFPGHGFLGNRAGKGSRGTVGYLTPALEAPGRAALARRGASLGPLLDGLLAWTWWAWAVVGAMGEAVGRGTVHAPVHRQDLPTRYRRRVSPEDAVLSF
jgi:hypothetical protein